MKNLYVIILFSIGILGFDIDSEYKSARDFRELIEYRSREKGNDSGRACIETLNGDIAIVGEASMGDGTDVFLSVIPGNENGSFNMSKNKVHRYYGGDGNDGAFTIKKADNGDFIIAGYTEVVDENQNSRRTNCWIFRTNEWGEMLWDTVIESNKADTLFDLAILNNGDIVSVGQSGGKMLVLKISSEGKIITTYNNHRGFSARAIAITEDKIGVTGFQKNGGGSPKAFFLEFNQKTLNPNTKKPTVLKELAVGKDIIYDKEKQDFKILGDFNVRDAKKGAGIRVIHPSPTERNEWEIIYEWDEGNNDFGSSLLQRANNEFVIVGYSSSIPRGSSSFNPIIAHFEDNGIRAGSVDTDVIDDINRYKTDYLYDVSFSSDNGIIISGSTWSNQSGLDTWLLKLKEPVNEDDDLVNNLDISIDSVGLMHTTNNDTLRAEDSGFINFFLKNNGKGIMSGLVANVDFETGIDGLLVYRSMVLSPLKPGDSTEYKIPILCEADLFSGVTKARILIQNSQGVLLKTSEKYKTIITKSDPVPRLKIVSYEFNTFGKTLPERGDTIRLTIEIQNFGEAIANNVFPIFNLPEQINKIESRPQEINQLNPGEIIEAEILFYAKTFYFYDSISVACTVFEREFYNADWASFKIGIRSYFDVDLPGGDRFSPRFSPSWIENYRGLKSGIGDSYFNYVDPKSKVKWLYPKDDLNKKEGEVVKTILVPLIAVINSSEKVEKKDVIVLMKGEEYGLVKNITLEKRDSNRFEYVCYIELYLSKGFNKIQLKVLDSKPSGVLKIKYEVPKLHVFLLGIPYPNSKLKYTKKDVVELFGIIKKNKSEILYSIDPNSIEIDTSLVATSEKGLEEYRKRLLNYSIPQGDNCLFIGSFHAKLNYKYENLKQADNEILKKSFSIIPSDKLKNRNYTSKVNLLPLILEKFQSNKSFIFLDACHSGIVVDISKLYIDKSLVVKKTSSIVQRKFKSFISNYLSNKLYVFTSSTPKDKAIEWGENGLFTGALKIALSKEKVKIKNEITEENEDVFIDSDEDRFVSVKELVAAVKKIIATEMQSRPEFMPYILESRIDDTPVIYKGKMKSTNAKHVKD